MPELPEVETIRRDLGAKILDRKILKVKVFDAKIGQGGRLLRFLSGEKIVFADRIGKLLIFPLSGGKIFLVHLKMTGQLVYVDGDKILAGGHPFKKGNLLNKVGGTLPNKHTRLAISLAPSREDGQGELFFNDTRKFGYAKVVSSQELEIIKESYGIEPLKKNFTLENLKKAIAKKRVSIKAVLLDQKKIAGIGNIYADEILFASGVDPSRSASSLNEDELLQIHLQSEKIIALAVKHRGTTFSDYVDGKGAKGGFMPFLKVYGRQNDKCLKCGRKISKKKVAGRGTHFCSFCQK